MKTKMHRMSRLAVGVALAGAAAGTADANWYKSYFGPTMYWAKFTQVPDFDQVRDGLPNNGNMYCVPTSAVNWMAYIAHHGYPTIMPGDHTQYFWHSQANFNLGNIFLNIMGNFMQTDPFDGTYGNPAKAGLDTWLDNRFIVIHRWLNNSETPDFDDIAAYTRLKIPVMACVGWYSDNGTTLTRNGGHCFSVTKVQRVGSTRLLTMHDPADEQANIFTQSPIAPRTYQIEPRVRFVGGQWRVVDKVLNYGSGYIDTYFAIFPLYGLSYAPEFNAILLLKPFKFSFDDDPIIDPIPAPGVITSVTPSPIGPWSIVTTAQTPGGPPSAIWQFDPETQEFARLADVADAKRSVFDRFGRLYVLDGRTIRCYNPFGEEFEEEANTVPNGQTEAMAFDDVNDQLLALLGDGSVMPYEKGLNELPAVQLPDLGLQGKKHLATSPMDGSMYLTSEGSPAVYHLVANAQTREFTVEVIGDGELDIPTGLSVGDGDCVFVTDSTGECKVFCKDPETGEWKQDPTHPLNGVQAGEGIQMGRSRTNYDPEIHETPEYDNVLPDEFGPQDMGCYADLNDDNKVDGADVGLLLGAWGTDTFDLNGDGTTDGADFGLMLGAWGDCPV